MNIQKLNHPAAVYGFSELPSGPLRIKFGFMDPEAEPVPVKPKATHAGPYFFEARARATATRYGF